MEQFEKIIQKNRENVANRIRKSLNIELQLSEGETEGKVVKKALDNDLTSTFSKALGHEEFWEEMQKAHKDGDMHPNGKWIWVSSANGGRGDWRTSGGRTHSKSSSTSKESESEKKEEEKKPTWTNGDHVKLTGKGKDGATIEVKGKVKVQGDKVVVTLDEDYAEHFGTKQYTFTRDKVRSVEKIEKEGDSTTSKETETKFKIKDFPGYKGVKMVEGEGYVVAFGKGKGKVYEVYPYLDYEDKKGNSMIIGLKGNNRGSLKEAKELSMKIAKDLKDKEVLSTLRNMEKDFISKMKGKTATEIKEFEFSWEDVLKASKEK